MKTTEIFSLKDFFKETDCFSKKMEALRCRPVNDSGILYRGQADEAWPLATTLERYGYDQFPLSEYISRIKTLDRLTREQAENTSLKFEHDFDEIPKEILTVLSEIRHAGGPSPLLDWTRNRDVALFFAFHKVNAKQVSVYVYLDGVEAGHGRGACSNFPLIHAIPYSRIDPQETHERYGWQESQFTYCFLGGEISDRIFVSHEKRFNLAETDQLFSHSDICMKYVFPARLQPEVSGYLKGRNICEQYLFGSEGINDKIQWHKFIERKDILEENKKEELDFLKLNGLIKGEDHERK